MEELEVFQEALAGVLNTDRESIVKLVKPDGETLADNAPDLIKGQLTELVKNAREEAAQKAKGDLENLTKKAKLEAYGKLEDPIRKQFNLSDELKGEELIAEVARLYEQAKSDIDEDKIRSSNVFLSELKSVEDKWKAQIDEAVTPYKTQLEELQSSIERQKVMSVVEKNARSLWDSKEIADSVTGEIETNQFNAYLQRLSGYNWKVVDGSLILTDPKTGEAVKNELGHMIPASSVLEQEFTGYVPLKAQTSRDSLGDNAKPGIDGTLPSPDSFKSSEEFETFYAKELAKVNALPNVTDKDRAERSEKYKQLESLMQNVRAKGILT